MTTCINVDVPEHASWDVEVSIQYGTDKSISRLEPGRSFDFTISSGVEFHAREIQHESEEYIAYQQAKEQEELRRADADYAADESDAVAEAESADEEE